MPIDSVNPATEEVLARFDPFTTEQVDTALTEAHGAFRQWRAESFASRGAALRRAAQYLRDQQGRFARLITEEMGKPIGESEAEIEKCAWNCDFYAERGAAFLADEPVATNARESFVAFRPLGWCWRSCPGIFPSGR